MHLFFFFQSLFLVSFCFSICLLIFFFWVVGLDLKAITLCPNVPVYWTNRALCHRKRKYVRSHTLFSFIPLSLAISSVFISLCVLISCFDWVVRIIFVVIGQKLRRTVEELLSLTTILSRSGICSFNNFPIFLFFNLSITVVSSFLVNFNHEKPNV